MKAHKHAASDLLEGVVNDHKADTITLGELKNAFHERGFGLLLAIFALPLCLPIPVPPGYTTVFSLPLLFLSTQMIFGLDSPWLPEWLSKREIKRTTLAAIVEKGAPFLRKIERLLKARMYFASTPAGERLIGAGALLCALAIAIPLPLTNWPCAVAIVIMSLGLLSRDGLTIIIGMVVGFIGLIITGFILVLGQQAVMAIFDSFTG